MAAPAPPLPDDIDTLKVLLLRRDDELRQLRDTVSTLELALCVRMLEIEQLKLQTTCSTSGKR
jgi:transposase